MDEYEIDYEALYKKLKKDIEDQHDYWKAKEAESHSIERETRVSEYGRFLTDELRFVKRRSTKWSSQPVNMIGVYGKSGSMK